MKIKKVMAIILVVALLLVTVVGCASGRGEDANTDSENQEPIVIKISNTDTSSRSTNVACQWFKEYMAEQTDGRVVVEVYPDGQLGDDPEACKGLLLGTVEIYFGLSGVPGSIIGNRLDVVDLPFLYDSYDDWVTGSFEKGGLDLYNELLEDSGYYCLDFMYNGMKSLISTEKVYHNTDDLKGYKLRITPTDMNLAIWKALGANPTPMAWGEVYTSLVQGTIDGLDHSLGVFNDFKFYENAQYVTLTEHQSSPYTVMTSTKFMDSLPEDIKPIFLEGIKQTCEMQRADERALEEVYVQNFLDAGATVYELTKEEKDALYMECESVYEMQRERTGAEIFDAFLATAGK